MAPFPYSKGSPTNQHALSPPKTNGSLPNLLLSDSEEMTNSDRGHDKEDEDISLALLKAKVIAGMDTSSDSDDNDIIVANQQPLHAKSTPADDALKDPFPVLSPIYQKITPIRRSLQSNCNGPNNAQQFKQRNPDSFSMLSAPETPPIGGARTPQSFSLHNTPIRLTDEINMQKSWNDPFPTPDNSVHNNSRGGTPCSSLVKARSIEYDGDTYSKVLNNEWETILENVPQIPIIEEFQPMSEIVRGRKTFVRSSPRLKSMDAVEPSFERKVSSEGNLARLSKTASLENLWGALKSGPDGNELVEDFGLKKRNPLMSGPDRNKSVEDFGLKRRNPLKSGPDRNKLVEDFVLKRKNPLKSGPERNKSVEDFGLKKKNMQKRRSKEKENVTWLQAIEYHGSERDHAAHHGGSQQSSLFHRSNTSPVEPSWTGLQSRLMASMDDDDNFGNYCRTDEINNTNGHFKKNSASMTNATGAELAKEVKKIIGQKREGGSPKGPLTPNRLSFRTWNSIKSSRALTNAKTSAEELVFSPVKTVRDVYRNNSRRALKVVQSTRQKLKDQKELRRKRRLEQIKETPRSWWIIIPADHPYKILWDVVTMIWAMLGAYRTHVRIRERVFDHSPLIILTEIWFTVDILLNFVTEHKTSKGEVIRDGKAVWARYLTTWFVIDMLSLIPWERIYVRPVLEKIKRRNFFQKTFFRSKAVVRVSRLLRGRHIKLFGKVSKQTGTPLRRLVKLVIKYLPKYLVFLRNMKGALVVRALRFVHWLHNMYKKIWVKARNAQQLFLDRRATRRSVRNSMTHPMLGDFRHSNEHDSDSDSDDDDDDESQLNVSHDASEADSVLTEDDYSVTRLHRANSEGSPNTLRRRRTYSHSEAWR